MAQAILVVPTGHQVGLTSVAVGLVHALDRQGIRVGFCKPIAQTPLLGDQPERSSHLVKRVANIDAPPPMAISVAEEHYLHGDSDRIFEDVVARYEAAAAGADVVIVEGLVSTDSQPYAAALNEGLARTLDANVVFVCSSMAKSPQEISESLEIAMRQMHLQQGQILGAIVNQAGAPYGGNKFMLSGAVGGWFEDYRETVALFRSGALRLLGVIPWQRDLIAPRVKDVKAFLGAEDISPGDLTRRVTDVVVGAANLVFASERLRSGTLFITSGDREDLVVAAAMAALGGRHVAAVLLTNGRTPSLHTMALVKPGLRTGLPILGVSTDSFSAALRVREMDSEVPLDDSERIQSLMDAVASNLDSAYFEDVIKVPKKQRRLSPPAFRHLLVEKAKSAHKRIVLPEGTEPRTLQAARDVQERGVAKCVLLAEPEDVARVAGRHGILLPEGIEILSPKAHIQRFIPRLVELRQHKGMNPLHAEEALQDNVMLGTMMLQAGEVDGLVSGAAHTTANTIRPALQIIKTAPGTKLVSSVFFMCLPDQVLVYADCAINPDPSAEELADIAIQSADSAAAFGIAPKVAMISYSTGSSGSGSGVDKVREATKLAKARRPDLLIDGPLQYDAAATASVAHSKAPGSPVAGEATVYIFPDLNTGNTTYKAVQRSAGVISIGPMLQGLRKPVNDLSRGALVEDIVFTIALTAIQAEQFAVREGR